MDQIDEFVDVRHKGACIYCGGSLADTRVNRHQVPSKCLLTKPYPEDLPFIDVHLDCNAGFSRDEEYLTALLGAVRSGSSHPDAQLDDRAGKILARSEKLRSRIESARTIYTTRSGEE